ncbi:MAG TPA: methyltransferase domain-containing protein [Bryobacteraceae bacterium]|nr:methyltransferase domain-containing protein [Bryobacteraceae bacterium]
MEFTGERVVFGQVDSDLWNEHYARYAYATRFSKGAAVLDAGCGTGYGSHALSSDALRVVGIDLSEEATRYAADHYPALNQRWLTGSCTELPFGDATFDTVVAFEVIEHLHDWPKLLIEAKRVLKPQGVFMVSTPNKIVYSETRGDAGPNPFHEHEFEYTEFRAALTAFFPYVEIVLENHGSCVVFESENANISAGAVLESRSEAQQATFYIAICSQRRVDVPSFVYVPKSPNLLRQRGVSIDRLEDELQKKTIWLRELQRDHSELVALHDQQTRDLEARSLWATELDSKLKSAGVRIAELQQELQEQQRDALVVAEAYESELSAAHQEVEKRTLWAQETEARLLAEVQLRVEELGRIVALLDKAEATVIERTEWAQDLQRQLEHVQAQIELASSSRWFKLGRMLNLGPELTG